MSDSPIPAKGLSRPLKKVWLSSFIKSEPAIYVSAQEYPEWWVGFRLFTSTGERMPGALKTTWMKPLFRAIKEPKKRPPPKPGDPVPGMPGMFFS